MCVASFLLDIMSTPMSHAIWKGSISFGLVQIPVGLYSAEASNELHFNLLDRRNMQPVRYERVSGDPAETVPWEEIVKGYQYEKDQYIILEEQDFKQANVRATETIDIVDFVDGSEVKPMLFEKPYYLVPERRGGASKAYALLRETLRRTGKVGISTVVIRTRQRLAALLVEGDVLMLNTIRYAHEIRPAANLEVPDAKLEGLGVSEREVQMAERLVAGMLVPWTPEKYTDSYRDDIMALIEARANKGEIQAVQGDDRVERKPQGGVVDMMALLKKSLEQTPKSQVREPKPGLKKGATKGPSTKKRAAAGRG